MLVKNLLANSAILFASLFLGGEIFKRRHLTQSSSTKLKVVGGILAGLMGICLMLYSVSIYPNLILDLRQFAIIVVSIHGGLISALVAGALMSIFRILYFGLNTNSILAIMSILGTSIACGIIVQQPLSKLRKWLYMNLVGVMSVNAILFLTLRGSSIFKSSILLFTVISGIVGVMVYYINNYVVLSGRLYHQYKIESQITEDLSDLISFHRADGTYLHLSPSVKKLLGYQTHELIGINPFTLLHPDDIKNQRLDFSSFEPGQAFTQEYRLRHQNGHYIWLETKLKSTVNKQGQIENIICVARDISIRKKMLKDLEVANQLNQEILNSIQDAFFALDRDWYFTYINKEAEKLIGKSRDQLIGKCVWKELPEEIGQQFYHDYEDVMLRKVPKQFEEYRRDTDQWFSVSVSPAKNGLAVYYRDITSTKKSEQDLAASESKFRSLVNSMTDLVFTLDSSLQFTGIYGQWLNQRPIETSTYLGKTIHDFLQPEQAQEHEEAYRRVLQGESLIYEWEYLSDQGLIFYQNSLSPIENEYGQTVGIVGVGRDITHDRQVKQELIRANEKLKSLSLIDPLTLVPNQTFFSEKIAEEWNRTIRNSQKLSLLILDIDFFQSYNKSYGNDQGDECLRRIAQTITEGTRRSCDFMARLNGGKFAMILPGTDEDGAIYVANNIRQSVERLMMINKLSKVKPYITVSIGGATTAPSLKVKPTDLFQRAERHLARAKKNGRNRIEHLRLSEDDFLQERNMM